MPFQTLRETLIIQSCHSINKSTRRKCIKTQDGLQRSEREVTATLNETNLTTIATSGCPQRQFYPHRFGQYLLTNLCSYSFHMVPQVQGYTDDLEIICRSRPSIVSCLIMYELNIGAIWRRKKGAQYKFKQNHDSNNHSQEEESSNPNIVRNTEILISKVIKSLAITFDSKLLKWSFTIIGVFMLRCSSTKAL